jgi:hypothetical protein
MAAMSSSLPAAAGSTAGSSAAAGSAGLAAAALAGGGVSDDALAGFCAGDLVGGAGVGRLTGGVASMRTENNSGPIFNWSSWCNSSSPLTGWSLTKVPLVLSKSRTKALPSRCSSAQWRLLIRELAGRRWHCGSRPTRNCASLISRALPSILLPVLKTTKLSFM